MQKILAKELGTGNIDLQIRLWEFLTTHEFDMGNISSYLHLNAIQIKKYLTMCFENAPTIDKAVKDILNQYSPYQNHEG